MPLMYSANRKRFRPAFFIRVSNSTLLKLELDSHPNGCLLNMTPSMSSVLTTLKLKSVSLAHISFYNPFFIKFDTKIGYLSQLTLFFSKTNNA